MTGAEIIAMGQRLIEEAKQLNKDIAEDTKRLDRLIARNSK